MIKCVEAPKKIDGPEPYIYLAGCIVGENWRSRAIHALKGECSERQFTILNPKRKRAPGKGLIAAKNQIEWEFKALRAADLIAFWFSDESISPLTLFELGVHSTRATIQPRRSGPMIPYPADLIIGCDPDYERRNDVKIQMEMSNPGVIVVEDFDDYLDEIIYWLGSHAEVT